MDPRVFVVATEEQQYVYSAFSDFLASRFRSSQGDPRLCDDDRLRKLTAEFEKRWLSGEISHNPADRNSKKKSRYHPRGTVLSKEIADDFLRDRDWWNLFRFKSIDDEAAETLQKYDGEGLYLTGVTQLSDAAAQSLSKFDGLALELNNLKELSASAASGLAKFRWDLFLDGLRNLTPAAAENLGKFRGYSLSLNGLRSLPDDIAASLGKLGRRRSQPTVNLNGIRTLTDVAAESLSRLRPNLELGGLRNLSVAAAFRLEEHKLIKSLTDADAKTCSDALRKFDEYNLNLSSLRSLPASIAQAIATFKGGGISLRGLKTLSPLAAKNLAKYKGNSIEFEDLNRLSPVAAENLCEFQGELNLDPDNFSEEVATIFEQNEK
ncbi:hypothetical protein CKO51_02725 [Rhodopirellula sp. SM50]|nr:hypothetical protein CKO51_02725 [Rhodopirellula sp. SM50]